jgi:hypothetical protein
LSHRAASVLAAAVAACLAAPSCSAGSAATVAPAPGGDDGGAVDAGAPADEAGVSFPAAHPQAPTVPSSGGTVLPSARIVPVFFRGETDEATFTDLLGKYPASSAWAAATTEYGIGVPAVAPAVHVTEAPPATMSTPELGGWLQAHLDGTHPEWGPSDDATLASSVYVLYPPASLALVAPRQDPSDPQAATLCGARPWDLVGWHWQTTPAPGPAPAIAFAVIGRCTHGSVPVLDRMTATTAHELVEAVTDPFFETSRAYAFVDDAHAEWMELTGGGELGDLCPGDEQALFTPPDVGHVVQRTWSNAAAAAGHDPCVPAIAPAYFDAATDAPDAFVDPYVGVSVRGVVIPAGQSRTIDVHLFSDAPTDAWQVRAIDPMAADGQKPLLGLSLDRAAGRNGDVLRLKIQPLYAQVGVTALYEIDSTLGDVTHRWYGEVVVTR